MDFWLSSTRCNISKPKILFTFFKFDVNGDIILVIPDPTELAYLSIIL
jgi:hypothetical protein